MKRAKLIGIILAGLVAAGMILPVSAEELESQNETSVQEEIINDELVGAADDELVGATRMGSCGDNATWALSTAGALTISGSGAISSTPWIDLNYANEIKSVLIDNGITNIPNYAFSNCSRITTVTIPHSVKEIDHSAFKGCSGLTSITIPEGVEEIYPEAFKNTGLTEVGVPISVKYISDGAFDSSVRLKVYKNTSGHSYAVKNNNQYSFYDVDTALRMNTSGWTGIPSSLIASLDKSALAEDGPGGYGHDYSSNLNEAVMLKEKYDPKDYYFAYTLSTKYSESQCLFVAANTLTYDNPSKTYMKIHCQENDKIVNASYFDEQFRYLGKKAIQMELPIYGGFYESAQNYFLVFGQQNHSESDATEVIRLVKYDKSWNRIASASVNACNTYKPFDVSGSDITMIGDALIVRTGHRIYKLPDGLHHQTNLSIEFDTRDMTVTSKDGAVSNDNKYGYVAHSFNQLIEYDENEIFLLDHGDSSPRALTLLIKPAIYYDGKVLNSPYATKRYYLMTFPGPVGENITGASVGGMVLNNSTCLIAGASLDLSKGYEAICHTLYTKNVFIIVYNRETNKSTIKYLTNYKEAEIVQKPYDMVGATNPYIIKIGENRNQVLWTVCDTLYQVTIDDNGNMVSSITSKENTPLTDCEPILVNGKLIWFTAQREGTYFYDNSPNPNPGLIPGTGTGLNNDSNNNNNNNTNGDNNTNSITPNAVPNFVDVDASKYYAGAVAWAAQNGITTGTTPTTFEPEKTCTRGQVVTFLWRAFGCPEPRVTSNPFKDVQDKSKYYYKAVLWAYGMGVTTGKSLTAFKPEDKVTRAEFVTFLWRAQGYPTPAKKAPFIDVSENKYYYSPVSWASETGVTTGTTPTTFKPNSACTRGQVVTFIYRALE